jgi:hypothetical protein
MTELKKWTIRRNPNMVAQSQFIVPVPDLRVKAPPVLHEAACSVPHGEFPCPVKVRYKYRDIQYHSVSIQTEV